MMMSSLTSCQNKSCPLPATCLVDVSNPTLISEMKAIGVSQEDSPMLKALVWDYKLVCESNEIDRN